MKISFQGTAAIIGDLHIPFQDQRALREVEIFLGELQPGLILYIGDIADFYELSKFDKNPARTDTLQKDMDAVDAMFKRHNNLCPDARKILLFGNHEDRLRRYLCGDGKPVASLDSNTVEYQYNLVENGVEWVAQDEVVMVNDRFMVSHGDIIRAHSAYTAKGMSDKHGGSGIHGHCFSEDTELLTKRGWLPFEDVVVGDVALTYNTNGSTEWQAITEVFKYSDYTSMVHFKNQVVDLLVTPGHSIVETPRVNRHKLRTKQASELIGKRVDIPNAGINSNADYPLSDDFIRLAAWVITEGNYANHGSIRISQSDKPKVGMGHISDICDELGLSYTIQKRYNGGETGHGVYHNYDAYRMYMPRNWATKKMRELFPDKQMNDIILQFSHRQFRLFFHEVILADGSKHSDAKRSYQYASKYKAEIDIMQAACAMNGMRSMYIPREKYGVICYCLTVNTRGWSSVELGGRVVPYEGAVYCCTVPNHTLFVRRNGKVIVAGNSHRLGSYYKRNRFGVYGWWENGCLCTLTPDWVSWPNWQQGFSLVHFSRDRFWVEQLQIINRKFVYAGKLYGSGGKKR
ncbi:hypothetical protein LCGC14_1755390 [marine sediment metagenome]|uniref:Hint domain-containing protein n=1 Tax=marine sediment metagenome TaxID=412755 RepID=A0A0F9HQ27_9ZZZZ